jgi:hypothetical protein
MASSAPFSSLLPSLLNCCQRGIVPPPYRRIAYLLSISDITEPDDAAEGNSAMRIATAATALEASLGTAMDPATTMFLGQSVHVAAQKAALQNPKLKLKQAIAPLLRPKHLSSSPPRFSFLPRYVLNVPLCRYSNNPHIACRVPVPYPPAPLRSSIPPVHRFRRK